MPPTHPTSLPCQFLIGIKAKGPSSSINDEIMAINDKQIRTEGGGTNFSEWCNYFGDNTLSLIIASNGIVRRVEMNPQAECFYKIASIKKQALADEKQKTNFTKWSKHKF